MKDYQYQNIYQFYKNAILENRYQDGDLLPSEYQMCAQFKVTRMTIRQALECLVQDGLIVKQKGKGSVVARSNKSLGLLNVKGFSGALSETHKVSTRYIIGPEISNWPTPFFFKLGPHEKQAKCIFLKRIRFLDEIPIMLETTFIPDIEIDGFCDISLVNNSLFDTLENKYNAITIKTEQNLRAVTSNDETIKYLQIDKNSPVLQIFLKFTTTNSNITIYSTLLCNTNDYYISNILT